MKMIPTLESQRLFVRPFNLEDLDGVHQILDIELVDSESGDQGALTRAERMDWLGWTVLGYRQYAQLNQPPFGDRAVIRKRDGKLVGVVGMQAMLDAFGQIPYFRQDGAPEPPQPNSTEIGLFYALAPAYQGHGYASEAAGTLIKYAFAELRLGRILATTSHDNLASIAVMRRLGMRITENPYSQPLWLQVVGVLEAK
ncbi:GNAT family N-acetyltransferase [Chloroflexota bacterium]